MRFVEVEEARTAPGLRLVVVGGVPSPWGEAAKGIFDAKGIDYLAVRARPKDEAFRSWTGCHNVPVVLFDDEPPRTGWSEILTLGERLGGLVSLVPGNLEERVLLFGLAHEILGEWGMAWCTRLLQIHAGLTTKGDRGYSAALAAYLGEKYGYSAERIPAARERLLSVLKLLAARLDAKREIAYLLGEQLSAVDIYAAVALGLILPLPAEMCPTISIVRRAFETADPELAAMVPAALVRHRDLVYQRHLTLPVRL